MTVPRPSMHHLALTVTDLDASVEWYSRVFDIKPAADVPHPGGVGRVLVNDEETLAIVLTTTTRTRASPSPRPAPVWTTSA